MSDSHLLFQYVQFESGYLEKAEAEVITEVPVSLTVNGEFWLTFMCTPVDLEALAVGFLYNEGLISTKEEIASVYLCATGDNIDVWLYHPVQKPEKWRKTSGCTGGFTSVELEISKKYIQHQINNNGVILNPSDISNIVEQLFKSQSLYRRTGGVHTSGLYDGHEMILIAEDIGRHNTLDKIAGLYLLHDIQQPNKVIVSTGRISSEMLQKSARLGASIIISRTSPSSLSIQLAENYGITLIGYARRGQFKVYTHPQRIFQPTENPRNQKNSIKTSSE